MRRRLLVIAGIALVLWGIAAAVWLVLTASDLRAGRDAASAARDHLGAEDVADGVPLHDLAEAAERFSDAHARADGLVLAPLRIVPVVGRQLRSVRALSSAAATIADAGAEAVDEAQEVLDRPSSEGSARVTQVREVNEIVEAVHARLETIDGLGPSEGLIGPLADARAELAEDLEEARTTIADARVGSRAALALVEGPRRYLVVAANNAEMRAGSGMWLQGGPLVTANGKLDLEDMVPLHLDADPPTGAAAPRGALLERWGFLNPGDEWRNLMASPRFPESAELATRMWSAAGRGEVDGVIAIDPIGVQAIIAATGPVSIGDRTIAAEDVPQELLHDQYLQLGDSTDDYRNAERRESLGDLADAAVAALDSGDWSTSTLIRELGDAISGRHVLAWSKDETEQRGWAAAGMSGELTEESLLVSVANRGANKLDWFLDVDAELVAEQAADGVDVRVELTLTNETPEGEPRYVQGPNPELDLDAGEYRGIVAVNVPGAAEDSRFEGVDQLAVAGADGPTRVVGFQLDLARGERRTVVLRFHLPDGWDRVVVEPSARVPVVSWRHGSASWQDSSSRVANL